LPARSFTAAQVRQALAAAQARAQTVCRGWPARTH
jgi:hypothetical protein